ncbi:MAG TPA: hypothetical protein VJS65_01605 [Verrucomicrobiae bacterium]|nr:hypothetical protein [Verrucomicrobiae bacterium]
MSGQIDGVGEAMIPAGPNPFQYWLVVNWGSWKPIYDFGFTIYERPVFRGPSFVNGRVPRSQL